jgi:predicted RNA-binding protein with RPS1 domain
MKKNDIIKVKITSIKPYGAFVKYKKFTGLIHISMINGKYISDIEEYLKVGEEIDAEILEIDKENMHLYLSLINTNQNLKRNVKLKETDKGFQTLKKMLPIWIKEVKFNKN